METCDKLSHRLLDLGLFCTLGTTEYPDMQKKGFVVEAGQPMTYASNNGVYVVYDEEGRPWIFRNISGPTTAERLRAVRDLFSEFQLSPGGYVPHSRDGGRFVTITLPYILGPLR